MAPNDDLLCSCRMARFIYRLFSLILAAFILVVPYVVFAAMSSTNYQIRMDSIGVGGEDTSSSSSYMVRDSLEFIQGTSDSSNYQIDAGYRGGIFDPVAQLTLRSQDTASQVAATAITSTSVTVTTTTGYEAGDFIAVIQNEGLTQTAAVGKVTSVAGNDISVDFFTYASSLPAIDGSNDFVYELTTGGTLPLASLTASVASLGIVAWEVNSDVPSGYAIYLRENQDLQTTNGDRIQDVEDGAVTIGGNEYGARSGDSTLGDSTFDTADTAITTSLQQVATQSNATLKARNFVTLKAAAGTGTPNGSYSQTLTFVYVGNY